MQGAALAREPPPLARKPGAGQVSSGSPHLTLEGPGDKAWGLPSAGPLGFHGDPSSHQGQHPWGAGTTGPFSKGPLWLCEVLEEQTGGPAPPLGAVTPAKSPKVPLVPVSHA